MISLLVFKQKLHCRKFSKQKHYKIKILITKASQNAKKNIQKDIGDIYC